MKMEMVRSNLIINEEKSIKNTSLYIKNVKINNESYEAKILSEENIENVIKYQMIYDGENRVLKYDVSNTIGFDEYLKQRKLNKKDICSIISTIDDMLMGIENYLLSENSVTLDLKLIRVIKKDNNKNSYKFILIPNYNADFSYELSKFLIRILRYVDIEDKEALSLAYGLFVRSSKDNYTMNDLMELIGTASSGRETDEDIDFEGLVHYDEEIASEIGEDVSQDLTDEDFLDNEKDLSEEGITIDDDTKEILSENILTNFDKEDKKTAKSGKAGKALKGHINLGIIGYVLAPLLIIILPIIFYFVYV